MDLILMLGGGGSLGAFDAGVWRLLADRLQSTDGRVVAVAGASIGAINAACIAQALVQGRDSADALEALWRDELATPSLPLRGLPLDRETAAWNGVLTGLLVGNRRLYDARPERWNPVAGLARRAWPLMDRSHMQRWLDSAIGDVTAAPGAPLLCVAATDVMAGRLRIFDSASAPVTSAHLCASSAIPLMFEPVHVDGRLFWDGDMTRESMRDRVLEQVARHSPSTSAPRVLVTVDHMSRTMPREAASGLELAERALELLLHGKLAGGPRPEGIDHVVHIERAPQPHDPVSGQFDYSPERIEELIAQGWQQAAGAWDACFAQGPDGAGRSATASRTETSASR